MGVEGKRMSCRVPLRDDILGKLSREDQTGCRDKRKPSAFLTPWSSRSRGGAAGVESLSLGGQFTSATLILDHSSPGM